MSSDVAVAVLGHIHTYPDIFESETFSFRIHKFPRPHVIGFVADLLFSTLESGFKNIRIRRMRVDGSRIRKEKNCGWKNIRTRVDGASTSLLMARVGEGVLDKV